MSDDDEAGGSALDTGASQATTTTAAEPATRTVQAPTQSISAPASGTSLGGTTTPPATTTQQRPQMWQPTTQGYRPPVWQPSQPRTMQAPMQAPAAPPPASGFQPPSIAQQAIRGSNPAALQAYMQALNAVGAGGNNAQLNAGAQRPQRAAPLIQGQPAYNGGAGRAAYAQGFGMGMPAVTYNRGLGAVPVQQQQGKTMAQMESYVDNQAGGGSPSGGGYSPGVSNQADMDGDGIPDYGDTVIGGTANRSTSLIPGGTSGLTAMSDRRAKKSVRPAKSSLRAFLDELGAHEYEYRDPRDGVGRHISPMAQELEKTPVGKAAVVETARGKMVDHGRLAGVHLAATADLHQRVRALEGGKRG